MEERIKELLALAEELIEDGADVHIVVMMDRRTISRTSISDDRAFVRMTAALGRVAERRLKK